MYWRYVFDEIIEYGGMFVRLIFETKKKERRGLMTMYVIFDWLPFLDFDRNSIEIKTCCSTKMIINNLPATRQNRCSSFGECYTWNANKSSYRRFSEADVRLNNTIEMRAMEKNFRRVWNVSKMIHRWLAARDWTREIYTCSPKFFFNLLRNKNQANMNEDTYVGTNKKIATFSNFHIS